ncbi:SDR family NAD(P)-dependent oxidoreductase [Streptosporangium algeriense]|uniref:SDR family NAD(P)-dependent oxidoreductase n=1 Tax=Streptosporangium algeriense TaxID=1682748 RepID=A0ABW3DLS3_9ACTN
MAADAGGERGLRRRARTADAARAAPVQRPCDLRQRLTRNDRCPPLVGLVASKAALRELADSLREEEAPHGVRVTTVFPGGRRPTC